MASIRRFFIITLILCYSLMSSAENVDSAYTISADITEYDSNSEKVTLKGNVEIFKEDYLLKADKIIYDKVKGKAIAYGNVSLSSPSGEEVYANQLEVDTKIKEVIANTLSATLAETNKCIAKKAHHFYPDKTTFTNVIYTPCAICKDKSPQWQIRSKKIYYEKKKDVSYWNNFFEIYGIPILYVPYLRTPAPDAKPRSGFLIPSTQKYRDVYGYGITVPYYYRIADNKDLTYSPIITTKQGVLHRANYKHLIKDGSLNVSGDYLHSKKIPGNTSNRYYILADGKYALNPNFLLDGKLNRVSDKSYLPNYWDKTENYLTSTAALNYSNYRDYGYLRTHYFQGLRNANIGKELPIILPTLHYHKEIFNNNNKYIVNFSALNLLRKTGTNTRRGSLNLGWGKTYFIGNNELGLLGNIRSDTYNFDHKDQAKVFIGSNNKQTVERLLPTLELMWKYPIMKVKNEYSILLEPAVDLIFAPNSSSNKKISVNEDSQAIEIEDNNLFSSNRYSGFDLIEHGTRVNYGLSGMLFTNKLGNYSFLFGQSYRVKENDEYSIDSGLKNKHFSDYVGRVSTKPMSFLDIYYKFRIDSKNHMIRKDELGSKIHIDTTHDIITAFEIETKFATYRLLMSEAANIKKSLHLSGKLYIYKEWYIGGEAVRSFTTNSSFNVDTKAHIGYKGDCTHFKISGIRKDTLDPRRNIRPTRGITLDWEIHLKNIN